MLPSVSHKIRGRSYALLLPRDYRWIKGNAGSIDAVATPSIGVIQEYTEMMQRTILKGCATETANWS